MPAAPKPVWIIALYFMAHFLYGVGMEINRSDGTAGLLELGYAGLGWLFITNVFFLPAPWIHESWLSPVIVIGVITAFVVAWIYLKGWIRAIALVALLLCLNAYSFYAVMLTGG